MTKNIHTNVAAIIYFFQNSLVWREFERVVDKMRKGLHLYQLDSINKDIITILPKIEHYLAVRTWILMFS